MLLIPILFGKIISHIIHITNRGHGSTWPGHVALNLNPHFLKEFVSKNQLKIILVAGTNGKTTTASMISAILKGNYKTVFQNTSGANLKNGLASSFVRYSNIFGKSIYEYAVFEVDENNLPHILKDITPHAIIILNLFRDQLDRYGELDSIATKWKKAFQKLTGQTILILNADDPLIASLGQNLEAKVLYYGLNEKSKQKSLRHASDSVYCPLCQTKLNYHEIYYSHLGNWYCPYCAFKRPRLDLSQTLYPLGGTYNKYNTLAATLVGISENIDKKNLEKSLKNFSPVFGRQEKLAVDGKNIQIFLSKNPTSFNESLATIVSQSPKAYGLNPLLLVLNDRIPDGRDISWIWDVDFEEYFSSSRHPRLDRDSNRITVSGDRVYDLALRLQYTEEDLKISNFKFQIETNLKKAIQVALDQTPKDQTLFILPTYSAMLEVRKILTGRKIL